MNQTDEMIKASRKLLDCPHCNKQMYLSVIECARHQEFCSQTKQNMNKSEKIPKVTASSSSSTVKQTNSQGSDNYFCSQCDREFKFNKIDILRHRQEHTVESSL